MSAEEMVNRLLSEDKLSMRQAGKLMGDVQGQPPIHPTTVARWCLKGIKIRSGVVARLDHIRVGGRLLTSRQAITRWLAVQTETTATEDIGPRTPAQRNRAADQAAEELERLGI